MVAALILLATASATASDAVQKVDLPAVDEALLLIRAGTAAELTRFNQPYRITVGKAPVDYIEVVTPFRRIVLAGSARRALGDRSFGQRQALDLLAESATRLDIYVEMTFHPQNTYVGVPAYDVALTVDGRRIAALDTTRISRGTPRIEGPPAVPAPRAAAVPLGSTLLGATLIGGFDLDAVAPAGVYDVVVELSGEEVARAPMMPGALR
jgi:hypothetical protein